ncbi:MAG: DUF512 domain-containing protein [Bacillota bacterium]
MKYGGLAVSSVLEESIAKEVGLEKGDVLLSINGRAVTDILDYYFYTRDNLVNIEVIKENGERWELEIEKDSEEDLGVEFKYTGLETITRCANKCIFCFVDQMPEGLRDSLYIKDDDYRLSFLQGSFITLSNMSDRDFKRVASLRLSPLYISVHTTNPDLRASMLGNKRAGNILKNLQYLVEKGIEIHTQAVICPEINDGEELDRTVSDLAGLWPGIRSLAVVPVGLTANREGLFKIRRFRQEEAAMVVNKVRGWQDGCLKNFDYPFVFASDEFYLLAGAEIPGAGRYADFPQIENGVGITRLFWDDWAKAKRRLPKQSARPLKIRLVTGLLGEKVIRPVITEINRIGNLQADIVAVKNEFFGDMVTVSGLLTGGDILKNSEKLKGSDIVVLPGTVLRKGSSTLLDDMTTDDLSKALGVTVKTADGPDELVNIIKKSMGD